METENIENKPICNCDDEFITSPCPIHYKPTNASYGSNNTIVTDAHMVSTQMQPFWGYKFVCPNCGLDSILNYFNFCPNCGNKFIIQSKTLTTLLKQINK